MMRRDGKQRPTDKKIGIRIERIIFFVEEWKFVSQCLLKKYDLRN